jgi:protein gp37
MGKNSAIAWCNHTFNCWWGCTKIGPDCKYCYAEGLAARFAPGLWGPDGSRRFFGDHHWNDPIRWAAEAKAAGVRARVFCGSMCDYLEDRADLDEARERLWGVIRATWNDLDWLLLTKRSGCIGRVPADVASRCWMGVTVGSQEQIGRLEDMRDSCGRVRWISHEPGLGLIVLPAWFLRLGPRAWVVTGSESGPHARPYDSAWARSLRDQCREAGVAFFLKQVPGPGFRRTTSDPARFPADLRIREFPSP